MKMMKKARKLSIFVTLCGIYLASAIQASAQTRGLSGVVELDAGVAFIDYRVEITVNNHAFIVVPPFSILRPVTSSESVEVVLAAGTSSIEYSLTNIVPNPAPLLLIPVICLTR